MRASTSVPAPRYPAVERGARRRRKALLASTALAAATLIAIASPASANGGAGGGPAGGGGGTTNATTAGGSGGNQNSGTGGGGGGGGAGTTGGNGGFGNNGDGGGGGGGSAAVNGLGGNGGDGNSGMFDVGGGGGGGGAHGAVQATLPTIAVMGGKGGNGGGGGYGGGSGGGGAGGYGAVITGSGNLGQLNVNVTGGAGGNGGPLTDGGNSGTGGTGGFGLFFSNANGATFTIAGGVIVKGGAAGTGGNGVNGAGISGQNLSITLSNGASVMGGGTGNAITFTGGSNVLTFNGTTSGQTGAVAVNGTGTSLTFNPSNNVTVSNVISGTGSVSTQGAGTLTLSGASTYIGNTSISSGTVNLTGSLANTATTVANTGTLAGTGKTAGTVTAMSGSIIAPGLPGAGNVGTLTMAGLALQGGSSLAFDLGTPNVIGGTTNDLIQDNGTLTLGGTLQVNQLSGFGTGTYRIANYTGMLTNNGLAVNGAPAGSIVQAGAGQVNLLVAGANGVTQYWNGPTTAPRGTITGGTGTWTNAVANTNWTDASGQFAESWAAGTGIFGGTAGTVTVNDSITFRALEFSTTGYTIAAGIGTLTATGAGSITTDPGVTATIAAPIAGTVGLTKLGAGMLILSAANGYSGGTTISAGTLQLGDGTNNGSVLGTITDNSALALDPNGAQTVANTITGTGSVSKTGTGTAILTATNSYQGGTTIAGGTLSVASDGNLGATSGGLTLSGGTLETTATGFSSARGITLNGAGTVQIDTAGNISTLSGVIADGATAGALTTTGAGTLVLSGANTYSGGTTLSAGILRDDVATIGTPGAITSSGLGTGTLAFDGGTLQAGLDVTIANAATTDANGGTIDADGHTLTYSGAIKNAGGSTGTLTIASSAAGGTVVVTAANAYTGATTISSGTLQLGNGTTSGSVAGAIVDNSALVLDPNGTSAVSTAISGTGTVSKIGAGTEVLSGTNSYQGGTTIAAGVLSVASDNNLGMTTGGLTFTGGTLETTADAFTSARGITLDTAGTVQVDTAGNTSTLSGTIGDGASAGSLTKTGAGTLVLSGTNTYSGGTTFANGSLDVGSANAIGTMGTLSFAGGTLQYGASNTTDYSGRFSMAANQAYSVDTNGQAVTFATALTSSGGTFAKLGAGTLTLTATNTYAGGTTISGGTLQIGTGGTTGAITGDVFDNATLAFDRRDTITFAGAISGTGGIDQMGPGTTILTGTNGVTGATNVNAGTLEVDGTLASQTVTVNAGGTLAGTGTLSDPAIATGGTLMPGNAANPYGTLTVGPLSFAMGSFYAVAISPTANSMTKVNGTTTINGGTVQVLAGAGTYATRQYTILTSTMPVTGTFSGVTTNLAFLMPTLTYDTNDVVLNIVGNAVKGVDYRTAAASPNQYAVAAGLTNASFANGGSGPILAAFNQLTVAQAQAAFDAISGEGFAAAQNTAFGSTGLFISSIFDQTTFYGGAGSSPNQITLNAPVPGFTALAPMDGGFARTPIHELADLPSTVAPIPAPVFVPQRTWRAWATGFGGVEDFSGNAFPVGSAGQSDTIYGGTLGIDYQLMPNYLAGLAVGGSNGDFSVPGRATSGSTTGGHVAFYDLATFGAFYAASTTSASFYSNQTTRTIAGFGGLTGETDRGNFRSDAYSSKVEFGRHFAAYGGLITPFASIELTELRSYGFTETPLAGPGLFALNVQGQDTASVPSLVGTRFQTILPLGNGLVLSPSLQLAWEHQFSPQRPVLAGLINLPGAVFLTNGASPARDSAAVKAGGELAITRQAALFANFDGDFSGVDRFYGGKGGFKYVW